MLVVVDSPRLRTPGWVAMGMVYVPGTKLTGVNIGAGWSAVVLGLGGSFMGYDVCNTRMCYDLRRDGSSRQFGFVGFEAAEDADTAKRFLNKTFMGASRIVVEVSSCMKVGFQFC